MFGRIIVPSALSVKCLEPLTQWHSIARPKTWIFVAKHCSHVWTSLHIKHVTQHFKSILLFKYARRWKKFKYISDDSMLHHCQRITWCSFKNSILQGEASVLPSLPLPSLASLVFFILLLCALCLLVTSSVTDINLCHLLLHECDRKMTRISSSRDFTHTGKKNGLLAVRTCSNWSTLSLFHVLC